jgi:pimeloyl-ACP methyl ester carboxylesterase
MAAFERIQSLTLSGNTGRFLEVGDGSPALVVASQLVRIQSYRALYTRLANHFRVTVLEMPGCGGASKLRKPWGVEPYTHWLAEFIQHQQLNRPLLIAHSTSGAAALMLSALSAHLVSALVLEGSIGIPRPILPILLGRALDGVIEISLSLRRWHDVIHNVLFHTRNFFEQVRLAAQEDLTRYARQIEIPVLLAHGRRDHTVPLSAAHTLHRLIPHSDLYIAPTGSHDWLITNPEEFTATVLSFRASAKQHDHHNNSAIPLRLCASAVNPPPPTPSPLHSPTPQ